MVEEAARMASTELTVESTTGTAAELRVAEIHAAVEAELLRRVPSDTECGICCKPYADIAAAAAAANGAGAVTAVLPCCHTVCRTCVLVCLERNSVACPVCALRFTALTTTEQVEALSRNPFIEVGLNSHAQCSECRAAGMEPDEHSRATMACTAKDCEAALCNMHAPLHGRMPQTRGHVMAPSTAHAAAAADVCGAHGKPLDTYCINCQALICLACTLKSGPHPSADPDHHSVLLSEQLQTITDELAAAKQIATECQSEAIARLAAIRAAEAAVDQRSAALVSELERAFDVVMQILLARKELLVEQVMAVTREKRASLAAAAGALQQEWTSLQGGVALIEQLLADPTRPTRVGYLASTAQLHMQLAARRELTPVPVLETIKVVVKPSVQRMIETVGSLHCLFAHGPSSTAIGDGLHSARVGEESTVVVTALTRDKKYVRPSQDVVQAHLRFGEVGDHSTVVTACDVQDEGDGVFSVTYTPTELGQHHLSIFINGEALGGSPFTVHVRDVHGKMFSWGGAPEYDNRGIIYYLATDSRTDTWENPHNTEVVEVSGTEGKIRGRLSQFVGNRPGSLRVGPGLGVWLGVRFNVRIAPTGYMLSYNSAVNGQFAPRNWNLEGSNDDGETWDVLKSHQNDATFNKSTITAYWPLSTATPDASYSRFRVVLTGKNSSRYETLYCSCIELYGVLLDQDDDNAADDNNDDNDDEEGGDDVDDEDDDNADPTGYIAVS